MNKSRGALSVIIYLLAVAALVVVAFFLYQFFANGQKVFSVSYGARSFAGKSDVTICEGEYSIFQTSYLLPQNSGYSLSIVPNPDIDDFDFVVDGKEFSNFHDKSLDFSRAFSVVQYADSFTVYVPRGVTIAGLLSAAAGKSATSYSGGVNLDALDLSQKPYFSLQVKSAGEAETVTLNLKFAKRGEK